MSKYYYEKVKIRRVKELRLGVIGMLNKLRTWLIFKLIGDQPVIANIDVEFKKIDYFINKPILIKYSNIV